LSNDGKPGGNLAAAHRGEVIEPRSFDLAANQRNRPTTPETRARHFIVPAAATAGAAQTPAVIIPPLFQRTGSIMEAEQLNIIANRLTDLTQRTAELRRYL